MKPFITVLPLIVLACIPVSAQQLNPLTAGTKHQFDRAKEYMIAAAEKMPEEDYGFRAVPEERTFAQFVGHVADANYLLCAIAAGEKPPAIGFENRNATKQDLTKSLKDAYEYCDRIFARMTDAEGAKMVQLIAGGLIRPRPETMPKLAVLEYNNVHNFEHYGNLTVYMRLKGVVPPSSETPLTESNSVIEHKAIPLSTEVLDQYVGTYELPGGNSVTGNTLIVTRAGEQLFGQVTNRGAIPLFAESDTRFFAKMVDAQIDFAKDERGGVKSAVLHLLGRDQTFIRR